MIPRINTASYTCADNKCYLVWVYDKHDRTIASYEIYRNNILLNTVTLKELDEPFIFLRFPRNKLFNNKLLSSKMYVDDTVKKFNTYEYRIRAVYKDETYSDFSNIKYVKCE